MEAECVQCVGETFGPLGEAAWPQQEITEKEIDAFGGFVPVRGMVSSLSLSLTLSLSVFLYLSILLSVSSFSVLMSECLSSPLSLFSLVPQSPLFSLFLLCLLMSECPSSCPSLSHPSVLSLSSLSVS